MWSEGIVLCMRENVEGKVERVCMSVCMRYSARDIVGVHQSKGLWARRSAAPDSALQEGLVSLQGRLRVFHSLGQKPWPS